jgi:hypothetical protein
MANDNIHTCKNCGNQFTGKYCNVCGEKVYTDHDKSIAHFLEDALHFITHFEGTLITTLKAIFTNPGQLSYDYCHGLRKKYFKPLSFFMLLVILYLLFPMFTGLNMPLRFYLNPGAKATRLVSHRTGIDIDSVHKVADTIAAGKKFATTLEARRFSKMYADSVMSSTTAFKKLETSFHKTSEKTSKILLLILIPLLAVPLWAMAYRKRKHLYDHLVLATEVNSFYLLFVFLIMPLVTMALYRIAPDFTATWVTDMNLGMFCYLVIAFYCTLAFHRFYKDSWWWAIIKSLIIVVAHYYIVQLIYKIILFAVTFYLSH